jgi:hypothetical protein
MPMFGVMRLTLERDGGSINGEEDFFSVARTIPFVAIQTVSICFKQSRSFSFLPLIPNDVTP